MDRSPGYTGHDRPTGTRAVGGCTSDDLEGSALGTPQHDVDVSIVVIAHNERPRITDCVDALLAQTTNLDIEVVVVDDGSTDGTRSLLVSRYGTDSRIRVVRLEKNQGRGAARTAGVSASTGRAVGFVDADIVVPDNWLDRLHAELDTADGVSGVAVPDGDAAVVWRMSRAAVRPRPGTAAVTGNNVIFDGALLRASGFNADDRLGEDFRLSQRWAAEGRTLRTVPDVVVEHREAKSYRAAVRWGFDSGVDATSLMREFHLVRVPDVAWLLWVSSALVSTTAAVTRRVPASTVPLTMVGGAVVVAAGHVGTRFALREEPARFVVALGLDVPVIGAYLLGRCVGAARRTRRPGPRRGQP